MNVMDMLGESAIGFSPFVLGSLPLGRSSNIPLAEKGGQFGVSTLP